MQYFHWPTQTEVASSWQLWRVYWPYDLLTEEAFDELSIDEKVALERGYWGLSECSELED
jgi:hypothetical protein